MFETLFQRTAQTVTALAIASLLVGWGWVCFAHMPFFAAAVVFCIVSPLMLALVQPLLVGGGMAAGLVAGSVAVLIRSIVRRLQRAG
ncbi:hypothetical protein D3C76_428120 [compost metagenome]